MFGIADCNNFFVSCERVFRPDLRTAPIVVLSNNDGCVVARSNESKALGVQMGDPYFKVKPLLDKHGVVVFSSNYALYGDLSRRVMSLLSTYTPQLDIYSIDEAFMELSGMGDAAFLRDYGLEIVKHVWRGVGIPLSLGIAPTRTLAKIASRYAKKYPGYEGVCLIDTDEKRVKALSQFAIGDVWGIGRKSKAKLEYYGVHTALDLVGKSESWVHRLLSITGVRTWQELKGESCISLDELTYKQSICTSRSFSGQGLSSHDRLEEAVALYATECARKLRADGSCCRQIMVFAYTSRFRTDEPGHVIQQTVHLHVGTSSTSEIVSHALSALRSAYAPHPYLYKKAGVILSDMIPQGAVQADLFDPIDRGKQQRLQQAIDKITRSQGRDAVRIATLGNTPGAATRHDFVSPRYTTCLDDILVLKAK